MDETTPATDQAREPLAEPSTMTPAAPPTAPAMTPASGGRGRLRWIVALVVVAVVVVATVGVVVLFNKPATASALAYVPGDAALVLEVRMDLPGDQLQHVGNLLAHFPGFADQSTLSTKIDEGIRRLIVAVSGNSGIDYVNEIKPWLAGPTFVGIMAPALATSSGTGSAVIAATTDGTVDCAKAFKSQAVTHESYKGFDLVTATQPVLTCVIDGRQALLGDAPTVKLALDAKAGGTGMDKNARYATARAALGLDRLATAFVNGPALASLEAAAGGSSSSQALAALTGPVPDWAMAGIRAEDDALVLDSVSAPTVEPAGGPSLLPLPATHPSVLAPMVPKDTLLFVENQGTGASVGNLFSRLRAIPELQASLQTLDGLGGPAKLFGWVDDVGVAVSVNGTAPDGAIFLVAKDEATASGTVTQLTALLGLLGQGKVQIATATVAGVLVDTITIPDPSTLIPSSDLQGLSLPTTPVSFSVAAKGKVIILATGVPEMTAILNVAPGGSLADDPAFQLAGQRGLSNSRTTVYAAAGASIAVVQRFLPPDQLASFTSDELPYLEPLQSVSSTATEDAPGSRSRLVVIVSKP
jgi:hypothetical protein